MQRQRVRRDVVLGHRLGDQLLGQSGGFLRGDHPADGIAAEDVEDHIQVEAGPFGRAFELRDVPAPDLVGRGGQEFRLGVDRVDALPSPLGRLAVRLQCAVQRAHRADVAPLVQQGGIDEIRRAVGEAFAVEHPGSCRRSSAEKASGAGGRGVAAAGSRWRRRASSR